MAEPFKTDPDTAPSAVEPKSGPLIFVVDDLPDLSELMEIVLTSAGYQARAFSDPMAVLSVLNSDDPKPRLLVTDYRMPQLNGMELIQRCKAIVPNLKVISASATLFENEMAAYKERPDRVLPKPYSIAELLSAVNELLELE